MRYRCISCGFWTGPRAAHWINEQGLCRACSPDELTVAHFTPPAPRVMPVRPAPTPVIPAHRLEEPVTPPRVGIIAALLLTVVMFCLTTLPVQPRAAATGAVAAATPRSTAGNPNAGNPNAGNPNAGNPNAGNAGNPTPGNPNAGCNQQDATVGGPYDATCDGSASNNGNGSVQPPGRPCAGCVGNADNQQPPGQMPGGSDSNKGYECDGNQGVGQGNPAHTACTPTAAVTTPTPTPSVTPVITPTPTPTPTITPTITPTPTPTITPRVTPSETPRVTPSPTLTGSGSTPDGTTVTNEDGSGTSTPPIVDRPGGGTSTPPIVDRPGGGTSTPPIAPGRDGSETRPGQGVLGIRISQAPEGRLLQPAAAAAPAAATEAQAAAVEGEAVAPGEVLPFTGMSGLRWLFVALALVIAGSVLMRHGTENS